MIFPCPKPQKPVKPPRERKRQKPVAKVNPARKAKRFEGNFGGSEYVELIQALPCMCCGISGYTQAAHLDARGSGGKADVQVPLCGVHPTKDGLVSGCHQRYDARDPEVRRLEPFLRGVARGLWMCWQVLT